MAEKSLTYIRRSKGKGNCYHTVLCLLAVPRNTSRFRMTKHDRNTMGCGSLCSPTRPDEPRRCRSFRTRVREKRCHSRLARRQQACLPNVRVTPRRCHRCIPEQTFPGEWDMLNRSRSRCFVLLLEDGASLLPWESTQGTRLCERKSPTNVRDVKHSSRLAKQSWQASSPTTHHPT